MLWAAMEEAAVREECNPQPRYHNVRLPRKIGPVAIDAPAVVERLADQRIQTAFYRCALAPDPRHHRGTFLF
jgi:hypothetical protein